MAKYELRFNHPYFVEHTDDDYSLRNSDQRSTFDADSDEEAVKKVEEFAKEPTGEKVLPNYKWATRGLEK